MYLNGILNGKTAENFITAFYGIYDMQLKTFLFSNAGHNTPFLLTDKKLKPLNEARSIPLAIIDNEFLVEMKKDYQNYEIKVNSGDRILLYTDGLTEENGSDGRHDSFEDYMTEEFLPAHRSMSIKQIVDGLMTDLERWSGSENFKDDVCIICMEIT
jgi:sigma-B regulation protein RsbU (phosphoserine phosphatase)